MSNNPIPPTVPLAQAAEHVIREGRGPHPRHSGTPVEPSASTIRMRGRQANRAAEAIRRES
jgi:hypothetical protein